MEKDLYVERIEVEIHSILQTSLSYPSRKNEIEQWIKDNHIQSSDLVIIDDDKSLNDLPKALKDRLVLTNPYTGLNDIDNLASKLNRRLKQRFVARQSA